jgi:hypothetical protein
VRDDVAQRDLRKVRSAARAVEKARVRLRDAVHAANKSGESPRDIAPWAGLSPTRVQELLQEARRLEREGPAGPHSDARSADQGGT